MEVDRFVRSPNFTPISGRQVRAIVLHDTEGSLEGSLVHFQRLGTASAHYVIGKSGELVGCVTEEHAAWHAARADRMRPQWLDPRPPGAGFCSEINACTIGVELELLASDPDGAYTEAQLNRLRDLVRDLLRRYRLGQDRVLRHGDFQGDRSDPRGLSVEAVLPQVLPAAPDTTEVSEDEIKEYLQQLGQPVNMETAIMKRAALAYRRGETRGPALCDEYLALAPDGRTVVRPDFSAGIAEYDPATGDVVWVEVVLHPEALRR